MERVKTTLNNLLDNMDFNSVEMYNYSTLNDTNVTRFHSLMINYKSIIFVFLFGSIFLFGIFTNLIVILVYLSNKKLKKHSNYFFSNLSLSDVLVLFVCIPISIFDLISPDEWLLGYFYCKKLKFKLNFKIKPVLILILSLGKMYYFIENCVTTVSSLTIIAISIERYCAVSNPLNVKNIFFSLFFYFLIL